MWRYREALPAVGKPISLGEMPTPLLPLYPDQPQVMVKCDYTMPTGSYKDRGAALLISHLKAIGVEEAVEDSSGNAGAAMAAYAARAGMRLKVFCPASASPGKLAQIERYGAELVPVQGPRPKATEALLEHVESTGAFYASHLWHPFFIEGIKTLAFEIAESGNWKVPDWVLCPVGAGSILLGLFKGFTELQQAGVISAMPRLAAIQAEHVSPVFAAFTNGTERVALATNPQPTLAEGIALPRPVRDREVLEAIASTQGTVVAVSEAEIKTGTEVLGEAGFYVEPTAAVVQPALDRLLKTGQINASDSVVLVLSGHGLKAGSIG